MASRNSNSPKSGYVEGRSSSKAQAKSVKPSRSSTKPTTKEERRLRLLEKAQNDLAEILHEGGGGVSSSGDPDEDEQEEDIKHGSRFKRELRVLRRKISNSNADFNPEAANKAMLRTMLAVVIDIIPIAEKAFRQTQKENAAYALNALINQARELNTDLKMIGDVENQAEFIRTNVIHPIFVSQAQVMMSEIMSLKSTVETEVRSPNTAKRIHRRCDELMRTMGTHMTMATEKMTTDIGRYLSGDISLGKGAGDAGAGGRKRRGKSRG